MFSPMIAETIPQMAELTPLEKWALANELWEEVGLNPDNLPVREDHVKILKERWKDYLENPDSSVSWEEIKRKIGKA